MAECSESDEELFITQSKHSSREVGSDTDNALSDILVLEECIQRDVSENLFSDISLGDDLKFCMVIERIVLERRKLKKTRMRKAERIRTSLQTWAILGEISREQTQFSGVHRVQKVSYLNFRVHTYSCLERLRLGALADLFGQNYIYFNLRSLFLFEI